MNIFYIRTLKRLLADGILQPDMRVLVVCGSTLDRDAFREAGFTRVVITNVDERQAPADLSPYEWAYQTAEALTYPDNAFDLVVVHYGLHHCREPHRALCEMYRVARYGVLLFEPCENILTRLGRLFKVGQVYEVHAVAANACENGGVNNGPIPNWVYRWTAEEIAQTVRAYRPEYEARLSVYYHFEIHWPNLWVRRNKAPLVLATLAWPFLRLALWCYPPFSNVLAAFVGKGDKLHPWLRLGDGGLPEVDRQWFQEHIPSP
jgi:SAM-dependent methyltransferase